MQEWKTKQMEALFRAVLQLENMEECANFMRDICTISELNALAERWEVAKLVAEEIPYRKINEMTGVSTATITRVAHWLHHGEGGYKSVLGKTQK